MRGCCPTCLSKLKRPSKMILGSYRVDLEFAMQHVWVCKKCQTIYRSQSSDLLIVDHVDSLRSWVGLKKSANFTGPEEGDMV